MLLLPRTLTIHGLWLHFCAVPLAEEKVAGLDHMFRVPRGLRIVLLINVRVRLEHNQRLRRVHPHVFCQAVGVQKLVPARVAGVQDLCVRVCGGAERRFVYYKMSQEEEDLSCDQETLRTQDHTCALQGLTSQISPSYLCTAGARLPLPPVHCRVLNSQLSPSHLCATAA